LTAWTTSAAVGSESCAEVSSPVRPRERRRDTRANVQIMYFLNMVASLCQNPTPIVSAMKRVEPDFSLDSGAIRLQKGTGNFHIPARLELALSQCKVLCYHEFGFLQKPGTCTCHEMYVRSFLKWIRRNRNDNLKV
jgi:hypothetical protein